MMFGRLENENLIVAPTHYSIGGNSVFTNDPAIHLSQGYKPVVLAPCPGVPPTGRYYTARWTDRGESIDQIWQLIKEGEEP